MKSTREATPRYPKPDFGRFFRNLSWVVGCLLVLHWAPDAMVWMYANFLGEAIVINYKRVHAILVIAYCMAGLGTLIEFSGLMWAAWQHRRNG